MAATNPRPFAPDSTDPRHVVAEALARYDNCTEIRPAHWWQAGRVMKALKGKQMIRPLRERPKPTAEEANR